MEYSAPDMARKLETCPRRTRAVEGRTPECNGGRFHCHIDQNGDVMVINIHQDSQALETYGDVFPDFVTLQDLVFVCFPPHIRIISTSWGHGRYVQDGRLHALIDVQPLAKKIVGTQLVKCPPCHGPRASRCRASLLRGWLVRSSLAGHACS